LGIVGIVADNGGPADNSTSLNGAIEGTAAYASRAGVEGDAGGVGEVVEVRFGEGLGEGSHGCFISAVMVSGEYCLVVLVGECCGISRR
jgi:hypothetical protein